MTLGYKNLDQPYQVYEIAIRHIHTKEIKARFSAFPSGMFGVDKNALKIVNGLVMLTAIELPPGEYEIYKYGAYTDIGPISPQVTYQPMTNARVEVKAREATYLGSLTLENVMHEQRGYQYVVADNLERDWSALENFKPQLSNWPVRKQLISSDPIGPLRRY